MMFLYPQSYRQSSPPSDSFACCNAKNFVPILELAAITNYKQWGNVRKEEKNSESKDEFYTKLGTLHHIS